MSHRRYDAARARSTRRVRLSATPARVSAPLASGFAAIVIAIAVGNVFGLSAGIIAAGAAVVALAAGVAARRTLASLAAGAGLLIAQPYCPGEQVRVYVPSLGSVVDAEIVRVGIANTTLLVREGGGANGALVVVANGLMLRPAPDLP